MRFPFFCWLAILALGTVDGVTAAPPAREPVAVAYLSSVDGVLDDIDYVVTAGDQPQLSQVVKGVIANLNNLEGIDRTQPIGLYAFLPSDLGGGQKRSRHCRLYPGDRCRSVEEDGSSEQRPVAGVD